MTVGELLESKGERLALELLTDGGGLNRTIESATVSSPGLVLAGYTKRFTSGRLQVLGETEIGYLDALPDSELRTILDRFFALEVPAVCVTKGQDVPDAIIEIANRHDKPLLRSPLGTGEFYRRVQVYLEDHFAPSVSLHGSLADVYGMGLLFIGRSGIGKSECVLDLVERGHRLVADDMVHVRRRGNDILIGRVHELQGHHMEIRGVGIIDVRALFGIRAVRQQKRIEVIVQLEDWDEDAEYERTGLTPDQREILGVEVPCVTVPVNPGKNITVISEVIAMNHLLKYLGIHSAQLFDQRLRDAMRPVRSYLEEDYE